MFRKKPAILFGLCSAVAACDGAPTRDLTAPEPEVEALSQMAPNTWETKSPMLGARRDMKAATISNRIYVVGGQTPVSRTSRAVQAYDVGTNAWSLLAPLPSIQSSYNGVSALPSSPSPRLYVTGGNNSSGAMTRTLYVYDTRANSWTRKSDMPQAGCCGAQGMMADLLYVYTFTGLDFSGSVFQLFRYSAVTNTWRILKKPPTRLRAPAAGAIGGKLYLAGGLGDGPEGTLSIYNPATDTWSTGAPMPLPVDAAASAVIMGKLYVAGGRSESGFVAKLQVYDPVTNRWTTRASMPAARRFAAGAGARDATSALFFVIGGVNRFDMTTRVVEAYRP